MKCSVGETLLTVDHVSLELRGNLILRDVSTTVCDLTQIEPEIVQRGQAVAFLAPSGMGKTKLFECMSGLRKPTEGNVFLNGNTEPVRAGQVGVLSQHYPLDPTRTAFDNLVLALVTNGKSHDDARRISTEKLKEYNLWKLKDQYPGELSGGQRQRVAYLQMRLTNRQFMLDDEPFSGLDPNSKRQVAEGIIEYRDEDTKNTVVITSHDVRWALGVADHIWLLGRTCDAEGNIKPGARIVKEYDLIEMGLCWNSDIMKTPQFAEFVEHIEHEQFPKLEFPKSGDWDVD